METRANYVLIGAFTLAGLLGAFGFLLWIAKVDVEQKYSYYDILFDSVEGLSAAASVRYNGLPVGSVVDLKLDEQDSSKVRVRVEIRAQTPITTNTVAVLNSQGVTGVSYVGLSSSGPGGSKIASGGEIPSKTGTLQTIFEAAPKLLNEAVELLGDIRSVVNDENRAAVSDLLTNLASASSRLDTVLSDFETLSGNIGSAAKQIAGFTDKLDSLSDTAETTLNTATTALQSAGSAADKAIGTLDSARTTFDTANGLIQNDLAQFVKRGASVATTLDEALTEIDPSVRATIASAQTLIQTRLPALIQELERTASTIETQVALVGTDASSLMARYEQVGQSVNERADQAAEAIDSFDRAVDEATRTLTSIRKITENANSFIDTEGRPLARQATSALASVEELTSTTLPPVIDTANKTLATVDREIQTLSAQAQTVLKTAQSRLTEARGVFETLDTTLTSATKAATSVTETSDAIYKLTTEDGMALVTDARAATADARQAIATINATIQQDLPSILSEIRSAASTANDVIGSVGTDASTLVTRLTSLADDASTTLAAATATFTEANKTLDAIYAAAGSAEDTLGAAETTFDSVNAIIEQDIDGMIDEVRTAVSTFTTSVNSVSGDVSAISDQVRKASQSAADLIGTVDRVVQANQRQMSDFLAIGLPQFQLFLAESRRLVVNLERLVDRVERDPARFLLGTQAPEFRR